MSGRILIVEDEEKLREVIALFMRAEGFEVETAESGEEALEIFGRTKPDLIILDAGLPGMSGFDVCRIIRQTSDVCIIFLTALGDDDHHMLGYKLGADDYLTKPFKVSILAMKAKRMLRNIEHTNLSFAEIEIDESTHQCTVNREPVSLTPKEFDIMVQFMKNPGRVLGREWLLNTVWGYDYAGETRVVDTVVKNLRKKLGPAARNIHTVISVGYKLEEPS